MAWLRAGTVAVTAGSDTVIGIGTSFTAAVVGDPFFGPDYRAYEIIAISNDTVLRIAPAYAGATASGQAYAIVPLFLSTAGLAARFDAQRQRYEAAADGALAGRFGDGSAAAPALTFASDQDTGMYRSGVNAVGFSAGGAKRFEVTPTGAAVVGALAVSGGADFGSGAGQVYTSVNGGNGGTGDGALLLVKNGGSSVVGLGNRSSWFGGVYDATAGLWTAASDFVLGTANADRVWVTSAGALQVGQRVNNGSRVYVARPNAPSVTVDNATMYARAADIGYGMAVGSLVGGNQWLQTMLNDAPGGLPLALNPSGGDVFVGTATAVGGTHALVSVGKDASTGRSINLDGTLNLPGQDYAEYERKAAGCPEIAKGQVVGFDQDGKLTLTYAEAVSFGVKSTAPGLVGGDWSAEAEAGPRPVRPDPNIPEYTGRSMPKQDDPLYDLRLVAYVEDREKHAAHVAEAERAYAAAMVAYEADLSAWTVRVESARQGVDRIGYSGKVPLRIEDNVGDRPPQPGDYIVPFGTVAGGIGWVAVDQGEANFSQYRQAVGQVRRILSGGRPEAALKVA